MTTALEQAIQLVLSGDDQLVNIISVTLQMSIPSSVISLLLGVPLGVLLAFCSFRRCWCYLWP